MKRVICKALCCFRLCLYCFGVLQVPVSSSKFATSKILGVLKPLTLRVTSNFYLTKDDL